VTATLRPVEPAEHGQALALWQTVFGAMPGYFERYYDADPGYRPGDTLGAWDGGRLVSAVHLCRRPAAWRGGALLCGGIANVATLPEFRRQGLSRRLLEQTIVKMEAEGFAYSLLGTGVHGHYAALGWEPARGLQAMLTPAPPPAPDAVWTPVEAAAPLEALYPFSPRPLQFARDDRYFDGWAAWNWRRPGVSLLTRPGQGYAVLELAADAEYATLLEWRAADEASERALIGAAAAEALGRGRTSLGLTALPQYGGEALLRSLGGVQRHVDGGGMIRRVGLSPEEYAPVRAAYASGEAAWWPADGF
jgi:predicted N-acetyltransferase YhbS